MPVFHRHNGIARLRDCSQIRPFESIMADHLARRIQSDHRDQLFGSVELNDLVGVIKIARIVGIAIHAFDQSSYPRRIVGSRSAGWYTDPSLTRKMLHPRAEALLR